MKGQVDEANRLRRLASTRSTYSGWRLDVAGGERAGRDHGLAARSDVIEHFPDQRAAQSFALAALVDLRMRDDHAVAGGPVLRPATSSPSTRSSKRPSLRVVLDDRADGRDPSAGQSQTLGVGVACVRGGDDRPRRRASSNARRPTPVPPIGRSPLTVLTLTEYLVHGDIRSAMSWQVYLSGEIHTEWRERIEHGATAAGLAIRFTAPVTDHAASDAAGTAVLGEQESPFWNDHSVPASTPSAPARDREGRCRRRVIRRAVPAMERRVRRRLRRGARQTADHPPSTRADTKEVDRAALAVAREPEQVVEILRYTLAGVAA